MSTKADFSAEEWSLLRQGPPLAGLYTLIADQGGSLKEGAAIAECYGNINDRWRGTAEPVKLVEEIAADGPELDRQTFGQLPDGVREDEVKRVGLERLRAAVTLLEEKGGEGEAEDYRRFVLSLAHRVAEAHKEGSFLGIGGTRVSEREQAALDEIAAAVGST